MQGYWGQTQVHGVFKERQNGTSRVQIVTQMAFHPEVPLSCTISKKKKKKKKERKKEKKRKEIASEESQSKSQVFDPPFQV